MFEFFENWCQDENRHGDFLAALLKSRPELLTGWEARQWSRFFCLIVYITMYVNDHSRKTFYDTVGLDTTEFNRHVITVTNGTVARLFPEVPDIDAPGFWGHLDSVVENNACLKTIEESQTQGVFKFFQKLPLLSRNAAAVLQLFLMPTLRRGSLDVECAEQYQY
jgi:magnesium-protoporphyrin IX monomethyl ester (oxidative) cyclase